MKTLKNRPALLTMLTATLCLTACGAQPVPLKPAADAANPVCAYAMVAMPEQLSGLDQRETTAQATTAWGDPAAVILKCGVEQPSQPVSTPCASVNGIDWIIEPDDQEQAGESQQEGRGTWVAQTFGRTPAVQVTFDADRVSSSTILAEIGSAVGQIPQQNRCTNLDDTLTDLETEADPGGN